MIIDDTAVAAAMPDPRAAGSWLRTMLRAGAHISADSRQLGPGDGFLACPGRSVDGRQFIAAALARGVGALLVHDDAAGDLPSAMPVPWRRVPDLAAHSGDVAAAFYGDPSARMDVIAITGTNGKTSCANWIAAGVVTSRAVARAAHSAGAPDADADADADADSSFMASARAAAIGTLGVRRYGRFDSPLRDEAPGTDRSGVPIDAGEGSAPDAASQDRSVSSAASATLTTPDAVAMQRCLAGLRDEGVDRVAIEASSIGLDQNRLGGVAIDVAVFTNLTRDHLDYHADMSGYARAKQRLFERPELRAAVVNTDDDAAAQMLAVLAPGVHRVAYGFDEPRTSARIDRRVTIVEFDAHGDGSRLALSDGVVTASVDLRLIGRFNALNAAAVCAAWCALGMPFAEAAARLSALEPVTGRMQIVATGSDDAPLVVVDYAHTPEALASVLAALAPVRASRGGDIWCVFGCGGDRDAGKRPLMAAACETGAQRLVLTSDNPRSEPPMAIIAAMRTGLSQPPWLVEPDRAQAIMAAVGAAGRSDIVLIAGKGHEETQEIAGIKRPFSDARVAHDALRQRRGGQHA